MKPRIPARSARLLRAAFFLAVLAGAGFTHAQTTALPPAPPVTQAQIKPLWIDLTPSQRQALAPLAGEWDSLDSFRKNKWLAISNRFAAMKPEEQQRMQERMRDWVNLTPEQRRLARESYVRSRKLNADQKSAQWEQYQQLPEEEKKKLAADAAAKKKVATLPAPAAQGAQARPLPPIKATPKPLLEQSVTPKGTSQSALQPAVPSNPK